MPAFSARAAAAAKSSTARCTSPVVMPRIQVCASSHRPTTSWPDSVLSARTPPCGAVPRTVHQRRRHGGDKAFQPGQVLVRGDTHLQKDQISPIPAAWSFPTPWSAHHVHIVNNSRPRPDGRGPEEPSAQPPALAAPGGQMGLNSIWEPERIPHRKRRQPLESWLVTSTHSHAALDSCPWGIKCAPTATRLRRNPAVHIPVGRRFPSSGRPLSRSPYGPKASYFPTEG